ncbi:MAG: hypothetical protein ACPGO3_02215 [Magnetospiraceae bacterium]
MQPTAAAVHIERVFLNIDVPLEILLVILTPRSFLTICMAISLSWRVSPDEKLLNLEKTTVNKKTFFMNNPLQLLEIVHFIDDIVLFWAESTFRQFVAWKNVF